MIDDIITFTQRCHLTLLQNTSSSSCRHKPAILFLSQCEQLKQILIERMSTVLILSILISNLNPQKTTPLGTLDLLTKVEKESLPVH